MSETVTIVRTAPLGYDCYPSGPGGPDRFFQDMVDRLQGVFTSLGFNGLIISATPPGVDDRGKAWLDTNDGNIYRWWTSIGFTGWARKHPVDPGSGRRIWWATAEADLVTEDGGDANPLGVASGPFWVRDTDWDGTIPLQSGTLQPSGRVVAVGATLGEDKHTLGLTEMPYHGHNMGPNDPGTDHIHVGTFQNGSDWRSNDTPTLRMANFKYEGGDPANSNATVAHENMPPCKAGFWAKRTVREYILPP